MFAIIELFVEIILLIVEAICLPAILMFYGAFKLIDWL